MTAEREATRPACTDVAAIVSKWTVVGAVSAGLVGGVVGLVVGLRADPRTAWFAIFEVGIPATVVGAVVGVVAGTAAIGVLSLAASRRDHPGARLLPRTQRWPAILEALSAAIVLGALSAPDWATRVDSTGTASFRSGPTDLLTAATLVSLTLALATLAVPWQWPRWILLATTITTACASVAVALASIAAANTSTRHELGAFTTSYRPGAALAIAAACVMTGSALVGLLFTNKFTRPDDA